MASEHSAHATCKMQSLLIWQEKMGNSNEVVLDVYRRTRAQTGED